MSGSDVSIFIHRPKLCLCYSELQQHSFGTGATDAYRYFELRHPYSIQWLLSIASRGSTFWLASSLNKCICRHHLLYHYRLRSGMAAFLTQALWTQHIQVFAISSSPGDVYPAESPIIWCRLEIGLNLKTVQLLCFMGVIYNLYMLYLQSNGWIALTALLYMMCAVRSASLCLLLSQ